MKRYSPTWWLVVLPTSMIVGGTTFLLAGHFTAWGSLERMFAALVLALAADLAIASLVQVLAPTKVKIGPGDRTVDSDLLSETAKVIGGFESSAHGHVSVRGETWRATRVPDDATRLTTGMDVHVVGRDGLKLIVSAASR